MKKTLFASLVCAVAFLMCACKGTAPSKSDSPSDIVEKYAQSLIKGDYEAALDLMYFKGTDDEVKQKKDFYMSLFKEKAKDGLTDKDQMTKCEILDEEIDEEAGSATVKANMTFADGHSKEDQTKLIRTDDGQWLIDADK